MVRTFAIVGVMLLALSLPQQAAGLDQKRGSSNLQEQSPGSGSKKPGPPPTEASGSSSKADTKRTGQPAKKSEPPPSKESEPPPSKKYEPPPTKKSEPPPSKKYEPPPTKKSEPPPSKKYEAPPSNKSEPPPSKKYEPPPSKKYEPAPSKKSEPPPSKKSEPPPSKKYEAPPSKKPEPPPSKKSEPPPPKKSEPPPSKKYEPPPPKKSEPPPSKKSEPPPSKKSEPPPSKADTKGSRPPYKASGPGPKKTDSKKIVKDSCWNLHQGDVCEVLQSVPIFDGGTARRLWAPSPKVVGHCWKDLGGFLFCNPGVCKQGDGMCGDPHMQGLRGQHIDWSGVDGGWYCLVKDESAALHVNIRLTAPLPEEFPDRQLVTGLSVISDGNSLVVEVEDPYTTVTDGCSGGGGSVCLANGGLHATVNGQEADHLLVSTRDAPVAEGIDVSSSNLPVECRQFGGDKLWARMHAEMLEGRRQLKSKTFEEWVLSFNQVAAPEWCAKYIAEHDLSEVQSIHAILKIMTRTVDVRLNAGIGHQGDGELDWDGRVLPDLEFWQMDIGLDGLDIDNPNLTGILGETARPVIGEDGHDVMEGDGAFRGSVEDYRVSGALGTDFALLA